jgi:hypothetical protein
MTPGQQLLAQQRFLSVFPTDLSIAYIWFVIFDLESFHKQDTTSPSNLLVK